MNPDTRVVNATIDTPRASQAVVNTELAEFMEVGFRYPNFGQHDTTYDKLQTLLNDEHNPRAKALRDAVLVAINTYVGYVNDGVADPKDAMKSQLEHFHFTQATKAYGSVYVDLRNAIQALDAPEFKTFLSDRLFILSKTLVDAAKKGSFSKELLAEAKNVAATYKGAGIDC